MKSNQSKIKINKIKFIIIFLCIYFILLLLFLDLIGKPLINLQINIIKNLFGNLFKYNKFEFVNHCSGIISIITYLSIVLTLLINKIKIKYIDIVISTLILVIYNLLRLILILVISNYNFFLSEIIHFVSWFVLFIIILLLIKKYCKNIYF
jgi:exosortase/archaeosortase family protein